MIAKKIKTSVITVSIIQVFHGISGILGGFGLIADPTGNSLQLELEWLQSTPFKHYLWPGIVLLALNGMGNIIGFVLTLKKQKRAGEYAIIFGVILIIWIIAQVSWIGYRSTLQPLYFTTGLLQILTGISVMKLFKAVQQVKNEKNEV